MRRRAMGALWQTAGHQTPEAQAPDARTLGAGQQGE